MFLAEKWLSLLWLGSCYTLLGIAVVIVRQATPIPLPDPSPRFQVASYDAAAQLIDAVIPQWEIVSIPVSLNAIPKKPFRCECITDADLPAGVALVDPESPIHYSRSSDDAFLRLKVNWRLIREKVDIPLRLSSDHPPTDDSLTRCLLRLIPLPRIAATLAKSDFREGTDKTIEVQLSNHHPFPATVPVQISLTSDSRLQTSVSNRIINAEIPANEKSTVVAIEVPDNDAATGDGPIMLKVSSGAKRAFVNNSLLRMNYIDDERVYRIAFEPLRGINDLDEEDAEGSARNLTLALDKPCGPKGLAVAVQVAGTAELSNDYQLSAKTFVFKPGQSRASITLSVTNDSLREGPETILLNIDKSEELVFDSPPQLRFSILDRDPLLVNASMNPAPCALNEGKSDSIGTLRLAVAPDQRGAENLAPASRTVSFQMRDLKGKPLVDSTVQFSDAAGVLLKDNRCVLPEKGSIDIILRLKDDDEFRSSQIGTIAMTSSDQVRIEGMTSPIVIATDNDPFPASLQIEGTVDQDDGRVPMPALDEADEKRTAKLIVSLDTPTKRPLNVDLVVSGKASFDDFRIGPSPILSDEPIMRHDRKTLQIPAGTKSFELPIQVINDESFEGTQVASFDLSPSVGIKTAKLRILDDDPVLVGYDKPIVLREGESKKFRIAFLNAPDGLTSGLPVVLVPRKDEYETQFRFDVLESSLPNKVAGEKQFAEIEVTAIADTKAEGRTKHRVDLDLPGHSTFYRGVPIDVWIDDADYNANVAVVIVVNSELARNWNSISGSLVQVMQQYKDQTTGRGITFLGEGPSPVIWDASTIALPVKPITDESGSMVVKRIVSAIEEQMKNSSGSCEALVIWPAPQDALQAVDKKMIDVALPNADKMKLTTIFYGIDKSNAGANVIITAASWKKSGTRAHRFLFQNNVVDTPVHVRSYLKSISQ